MAEARALYGKLMAIAEQHQDEMDIVLVRFLLADLDYLEGQRAQAKGALQAVLAYRSSAGRPIPD